jgi:hypothetical protein
MRRQTDDAKERPALDLRSFQEVDCHFCGQHIAVTSNADLDAMYVAEMAALAAGAFNAEEFGDLDDLFPGESVCRACAERWAGPDRQAKGAVAIDQHEAWRVALDGRDDADLWVIH